MMHPEFRLSDSLRSHKNSNALPPLCPSRARTFPSCLLTMDSESAARAIAAIKLLAAPLQILVSIALMYADSSVF